MLLLFPGEQALTVDVPRLSPDQEKVLETARATALEYTQRLPDFICTQTTQREFSSLSNPLMGLTGVSATTASSQMSAMTPGGAGANSLIEEKLTFFNQKESYEVTAIDGKKVSGIDHMLFQGAISAGEFGSALNHIFNPQSHTVFTSKRMEHLHGRRAYVFGFHVPPEGGIIVIHKDSGRRIIVPYSGQVSVDADTLAVLQIISKLELPPAFPIVMGETTVDYRPIQIAGKNYNLPYRSEVRMKDTYHLFVNRIEFKNYQKFTVESTIHYGRD
jgi:hypothetical protein